MMKHKFKQLTDFVMKKGGIQVLNNLPNSEEYVSGRNQRNEFEDFIGFKSHNDTQSVFADTSSVFGSTVKKSIRGGQVNATPQRTVIRGGTLRNTSFA